MEFIEINTNEQENITQTNETCNTCKDNKITSLELENLLNDKSGLKTETLINLIAYFYELFQDKDTKDRFEPFIKDCKEQAIKRVEIKNMLVFKDKEIPDSSFDSGMNVVPNETPQENNDNPSTEMPQDKDETNENQETENDTQEQTDKDNESNENQENAENKENTGSDIITDTDINLKQ